MAERKDSTAQLLIIAAIVLTILALSWLALNKWNAADEFELKPQQANPNAGSITSVPAPTTTLPIKTNLELAKMAFESGQLIDPYETSALYFFQLVLSQDSNNISALEGLDNISQQLVEDGLSALEQNDFTLAHSIKLRLASIDYAAEQFEQLNAAFNAKLDTMFFTIDRSLRRGQFFQADALIETLQAIPDIEPERIQVAVTALADARATAALEAATDQSSASTEAALSEETQTDAAAATIASLSLENDTPIIEEIAPPSPLEMAKYRLTNANAFSPPGDSAMDYLAEALQLEPDNQEALELTQSIIESVTQRALILAKDNNFEAAKQTLSPLSEYAIAQFDLTTARNLVREAELEQLTRQVVGIDTFEIQSSIAPSYPQRARQRGIEGRVTLSFEVDTTGVPRDIQVVETSRRLAADFTRAATNAVTQWRFVSASASTSFPADVSSVRLSPSFFSGEADGQVEIYNHQAPTILAEPHQGRGRERRLVGRVRGGPQAQGQRPIPVEDRARAPWTSAKQKVRASVRRRITSNFGGITVELQCHVT